MLNAKQIYLDTINNGGSSTNCNGQHPTTGYMVALEGCELTYKLDWFNTTAIKESLLYMGDELADDEHFLGTWLDGNTVYLNISINVDSLEESNELAKKYHQLAIYDVVRQESINIS